MSKLANTISPNLVIVTMIGPSHLEGLGTVENIASEKADLFLTSNKTETVIFPEDCLKYEKFQTRYDSGKGVVVLREGEPKSDPSPNEAFTPFGLKQKTRMRPVSAQALAVRVLFFFFINSRNVGWNDKECRTGSTCCV